MLSPSVVWSEFLGVRPRGISLKTGPHWLNSADIYRVRYEPRFIPSSKCILETFAIQMLKFWRHFSFLAELSRMCRVPVYTTSLTVDVPQQNENFVASSRSIFIHCYAHTPKFPLRFSYGVHSRFGNT